MRSTGEEVSESREKNAAPDIFDHVAPLSLSDLICSGPNSGHQILVGPRLRCRLVDEGEMYKFFSRAESCISFSFSGREMYKWTRSRSFPEFQECDGELKRPLSRNDPDQSRNQFEAKTLPWKIERKSKAKRSDKTPVLSFKCLIAKTKQSEATNIPVLSSKCLIRS